MSRIGKKLITKSSDTLVEVKDQEVIVQGKLGKLSFSLPQGIDCIVNNDSIQITREDDSKKLKSLHGLTRAVIANHVIGVEKGYEVDLQLFGIGYRVSAEGTGLKFTVGKSHPVLFDSIEGIKFEVDGQTKLKVSGIDKELVGQVVSNIRRLPKKNNFHKKGIFFPDEQVKLKPGKSVGK